LLVPRSLCCQMSSIIFSACQMCVFIVSTFSIHYLVLLLVCICCFSFIQASLATLWYWYSFPCSLYSKSKGIIRTIYIFTHFAKTCIQVVLLFCKSSICQHMQPTRSLMLKLVFWICISHKNYFCFNYNI